MITAGGSAREVADYAHAVRDAGARFVLYFYSSDLSRDVIHDTLTREIPRAAVAGCSMIGGWGPEGPRENGVVLMGIGDDELSAVHLVSAGGTKDDPVAAADSLIEELGRRVSISTLSPARHVGIVLLDGLALGERIIRRLSESLPIPLVGGAAADELTFEETTVAADGTVRSDGVVLAILEMRVPFHYGHFVHYQPTKTEFTVTDADPDSRTIWAIDGKPAAEYYAGLLGLSSVEEITVDHFSVNPFGVVIGDEVYVRSPNAVVDGRGIRLYCYIEAGTRLRLLTQGDIIANAREALQEAEDHLGRVRGVILFNCVLRYLEMKNTPGLLDRFAGVFEGPAVVGINTYGEELFTHHNQTLTALFIGGHDA